MNIEIKIDISNIHQCCVNWLDDDAKLKEMNQFESDIKNALSDRLWINKDHISIELKVTNWS